jgi:hypothetical protein
MPKHLDLLGRKSGKATATHRNFEMKNPSVTQFLDDLNHPFRQEIEQLRECILSASEHLSENIKWNGPNYSLGDDDRITMRVQPLKKQAQLIFHRGAKKQAQPKDKLIKSSSKLLDWKENDRAVVTFKSMLEIEKSSSELSGLVREWLEATRTLV